MRAICLFALVLLPAAMAYSSASSYGSASSSGAYSSASGSATSSSTSKALYNSVKATLFIAGVSPSAFAATTPAGTTMRLAFKKAVAKGLKICGTDGKSQCTSNDVVIESVSRRRADVTVKFYVKTQSAAAAAGATSLENYVNSGTGGTTFLDILKAEAKTAGVLDAVLASAKAPTFTQKPTAAEVSTPTPAVSRAGKTAVAGGVTMALAGLAMLW